jgi:spoIIIJ-associated protein
VENVEIEVRARTVELAIEAAMQELGIDDPKRLEVHVITEPTRGFLGLGGQDAVVRIKPRPVPRERRKRRGRKGGGGQEQNRAQGRHESGKNGGRGGRQNRSGGRHARNEDRREPEKREKTVPDDRPILPLEEQAELVREFLEGLVEAYGLEGTVTTRLEDDVIIADVSGDQTEALVGVRGSVRAAIHEITRTVLQRHGQDSARLRLDIAGYAERRRQALTIYAEQLIQQLLEEGGEIMLEPMSPADRKVIHDVAAAHEGVTSYSEGEPPRRYVVLSKVESSEEE